MSSLELVAQTQREEAFLGVAEDDLGHGVERDVEVDGAHRAVSGKEHGAILDQQDLARGIAPFEDRPDNALLRSILNVADFAQHDQALLALALLGFVGPEVDAVDVAVGDPEAALVRVVAAAGLRRFHRIEPGQALAGGAEQRVQVGLGRGWAEVKSGEGPANDFDGDGVRLTVEMHLGGGRHKPRAADQHRHKAPSHVVQ